MYYNTLQLHSFEFLQILCITILNKLYDVCGNKSIYPSFITVFFNFKNISNYSILKNNHIKFIYLILIYPLFNKRTIYYLIKKLSIPSKLILTVFS